MEEFEPAVAQDFIAQTPKKGNKIIFIVLGILLLLSVCGYAAVNYFPELIFSPKNMYLWAEKQTMDNFQKQVNNYLNDAFVKDFLKVYTNAYERQSDITVKLNTDKLDIGSNQQFDLIKNLLENSKFSVTQNVDVKNDKMNSNLSVAVKGSKLLGLNLFMNKNQIGISVPELYSKYLAINTDDLASVYQKFGVENGPKKLVKYSDIIKAIKIDKKDITDIQKDYMQFFIDSISNDDVKFSKDIQLSTKDGNIKCRELTVTLSNARVKEISEKFYDKISKDEKLLNLMGNNVVNVMKLYDDAGYFAADGSGIPDEFKNVDAFKEMFKKNINDAKGELENLKATVVVNLYIDKKYNVLQREINLSEEGGADGSLGSVKIASYKNPKSDTTSSILEINTSDVKITFNKDDAKKEAGKPQTSTITFGLEDSYDKGQSFEGKINLSVDAKDDKTKKVTADFDIKPNKSGVGSVYGSLTEDLSRDSSKKTINADTTYSVNIKAPEDGMQSAQEVGLSINLKEGIKFDVPVTVPSLTANNSLNLNSATTSEMEAAYREIQSAAMQLIQNNRSLLMGN